jgi:DNA gyrase subunit A
LDIEVPTAQGESGANVWEDLRRSIESTPAEGTQVAVATEEGDLATGIDITGASSRAVHALELSVWKAYSESQSLITHVLIVTAERDYAPCGGCLQAVHDFSEGAAIRMESPSGDRYGEASLNTTNPFSLGKLTGEETSGNIDDTTSNDDVDSGSMSIPETPPFLDIEVDDSVPVEYVRLNAPVYHLKYQNHHETFCGTSLANRDWASSTEDPNLMEPCKRCHGETSQETVEEQRKRLRRELAREVEMVREESVEPEVYTVEELEGILTEVPVTAPEGQFDAVGLRTRLAECIVGIDAQDESPLTLSRDDIESILASLDGDGVISDRPHVFAHTSDGRAARLDLEELNLQHRSGKGQLGLSLDDNESLDTVLSMNPREQLFVFTNLGQVHQVDAHRIPAINRRGEPSSLADVIQLDKGESLCAVVSCKHLLGHEYVILATESGYIKRTPTSAFENIHTGGIRAIDLEEGDSLAGARLLDTEGSILMTTRTGRTIRFNASDARPMGRSVRGVSGMKIDTDEKVVAVNTVSRNQDGFVLTVTQEGYGKRTSIEEYNIQTRNGRGLIDISTNERNGPVAGVAITTEEAEFVGVTERGRTIRVCVDEISVQGRNTLGVGIMGLNSEDAVAGFDVFTDT